VSDLLEKELDSSDLHQRQKALQSLLEKEKTGLITFPPPAEIVNLHCHTFFSFNCYGYSPTKFAYLAKKSSLAVAGIVDFDVLDGLDEFLSASSLLDLKASVGIESRVFVPEFADKVINSPGEPGITYHMGVGFTTSEIPDTAKKFLQNLKSIAQKRNKAMMQRVNQYLSDIALDYNSNVIPLTPASNPTERHICLAFAKKARTVFHDDAQLADYWTKKLNAEITPDDLPNSVKLLNTIRAKTMKQGGVGYVRPDAGEFPKMADMNQFVLQSGAIPTLTWLDGTSDGEQKIEKLLEIAVKTGVAAVNIVPDRNFTPGVKDQKLKNLYHFVKLAEQMNLPVFVGTEMNSPGQKFVDDLHSDELKPLLPVFLNGARIAYAHSALHKNAKLGYLSDWAKKHFFSSAPKNRFYQTVGEKLQPQKLDTLNSFNTETKPEQIIKALA
jgi:hypothetical protein